MPPVVEDPRDPRLDEVRLLRSADAVLRRSGLVVAEGVTMVERWLRQGRPLHRLVLTPSMWQRLEPLLGDRLIPVVVKRDTLAEAAGFDVHRGVLAFLAQPVAPPWHTVLTTSCTTVVTEGLNDAENLGALMRCAWALGADALVLDPTTLDPFGRRVVRVSMGAALELPVVRAPVWPDALAEMRRRGVTTLGLTPRADATPVSALRVRGDERVAILVGAEGPGLSTAALDQVDMAVRIPMRTGVDSLNVAHAAAIVLAALDRAPTIGP